MPAATKRLSPEVLSVLANCTTEGTKVHLPPGQLDRKLYTAVAAALECMGCKWDRKAKAHVSDGDASDDLELMISTGEAIRPLNYKQVWQFFETPDHIADDMCMRAGLRQAQDNARILEPSAGKGAIVRSILRHAPSKSFIYAVENQSELQDYLRSAFGSGLNKLPIAGDFLTIPWNHDFDYILMNPPFCKGQDAQHIRHAYSLLTPGGSLVAIAGAGVTFRNDGQYKGFREWVAEKGGVIEQLPEGTFKDSGTMVNSVMVVMGK